MYRQFEVPDEEQEEAIFDQPDPTDIAMIFWLKGQAIGFYTIKPKGNISYILFTCCLMNSYVFRRQTVLLYYTHIPEKLAWPHAANT